MKSMLRTNRVTLHFTMHVKMLRSKLCTSFLVRRRYRIIAAIEAIPLFIWLSEARKIGRTKLWGLRPPLFLSWCGQGAIWMPLITRISPHWPMGLISWLKCSTSTTGLLLEMTFTRIKLSPLRRTTTFCMGLGRLILATSQKWLSLSTRDSKGPPLDLRVNFWRCISLQGRWIFLRRGII